MHSFVEPFVEAWRNLLSSLVVGKNLVSTLRRLRAGPRAARRRRSGEELQRALTADGGLLGGVEGVDAATVTDVVLESD